MEEFLAALLGGLFELLGEVLLQVLLEALVGAVEHLIKQAVAGDRVVRPVFFSIGYLILGALAGVASIAIFPHRLTPVSRFHGISLLISPLVTGLIMAQIGNLVRRTGRPPARIESFAYGFAFALGMAAVRFVYFR